jgi:methylmalonyl-CoA mutase N-terminal domain/subunit
MKKNNAEEQKTVVLESGIEVKPVYGPEDTKGLNFDEKIGHPGEYPFTRGIHPRMYRKRPWTMRQYSGFGTPKETNERRSMSLLICPHNWGWIRMTRLQRKK